MRRRSLLLAFVAVTYGCDATAPTTPNLGEPDAQVAAGLGIGYTKRDLGTLGGQQSEATDINNLRVVVGWSLNADGVRQAFKWTKARGMVALATLPGAASCEAVRVFDDGRVFGSCSGVAGVRPVMWSANGAASALPVHNLSGYARTTQYNGFNRKGDVIGTAVERTIGPGPLQTGWIWSPGFGTYDLGINNPHRAVEGSPVDLNERGQVVMIQTDDTNEIYRSAYLWDRNDGFAALGKPVRSDIPSTATECDVGAGAINNWGTVAGGVECHTPVDIEAPNNPRFFWGRFAFTWTRHHGFTILRTLGSTHAVAFDINDWGTVVGMIGSTAAVWPLGGYPVLLSPGRATAANDLGAIAGVSNNRAAIWTLGLTD